MLTTFQITEIELIADGVIYDLHNNFDFIGYEYQSAQKEVWLRWRRGDGKWVPKDTPASLTLRFTGVSNFATRRRDDEMPFSEDTCLANMTFSPPEFADDFDAVFGGFRRPDEHLTLIFQSRAALKIWAENAIHEISQA